MELFVGILCATLLIIAICLFTIWLGAQIKRDLF